VGVGPEAGEGGLTSAGGGTVGGARWTCDVGKGYGEGTGCGGAEGVFWVLPRAGSGVRGQKAGGEG